MRSGAKVLLAFLLGLATVPLVVIFSAYLGLFAVPATDQPPRWEEAIAERALDVSLARRAQSITAPMADSEETLLAGLKIYRNNCAGCHGDFGGPSSWGSNNFYPRVPQFSEHAPDLTAPKMFLAIKYGIRYSGMGAWKGMMPEDEIWRVALFLSHLESLPPGVDAVWRKATGKATVDLRDLAQEPLVADCVSTVEHGMQIDRPIVLDRAVEAQLRKQMGVQNIREPLCWHQAPNGELYLRASSACGGSLEFHFQKLSSAWSMTRIEVRSCDQRADHLQTG